MSGQQYNTKCAGVKRLMKEAMELREPTEMYYAQPLEDNLFEWHFTIRGTLGTDFDGGIYHGRIIFPPEYPMKPPNMIILTPNGRFELNRKICLSISGYHPETWLPSWSIRTALLALIGFFYRPQEPEPWEVWNIRRQNAKRLAKISAKWRCSVCDCTMKDVLLPLTDENKTKDENEEATRLAAQLKFSDEATKKKEIEEATASEETTAIEDVAVEESPPVVAEAAATPPVAEPNLSPRLTRPRPSDTCDYSMFLIVPVCVVALAIFMLLLSRRVLSS
ncbi:unnamed protein product [Caenorhabditis auriculariae]|uniref:UBC core domain-containing protein n=1 Tax=Caenorhabditis auriculariae TaxID=2777116 RepID=A0A8S1H8T7_9PELO|nr:unnamed protein product [Caenorhabditis auriculariae]